MNFEDAVGLFVLRQLTPRGLPKDLFKFSASSEGGGIDITMPDGRVIEVCPDGWYCNQAFVSGGIIYDFNKFINEYAAQYHTQNAKNLREENAALVAQVAKLQRKIEKLQLAPGGKEYLAAKTHFETSRDKK